jgi:2-polyprenyl-3-methyl-5-hydroxy-6-metoxy-1,4-benzoquinol methylase
MRKPAFDPSWLPTYKECFENDEIELWNDTINRGHARQYRNRREAILSAVEKLMPAGSKILDVAAAGGNFTLPLAEKGFHMVWNDFYPEWMEWVKMKYEHGVVEYAPGNIFDKSAEFQQCFDGVIATEVIEHVAHPDAFLVNLATMVKPGGWLFMSTPNGRYFLNRLPKFSDCPDTSVFEADQFKPDSDGHIFLLHPSEIIEMTTQSKLHLHTLSLANNPLSGGHLKLSYLLRVLPKRFVDLVEATTQRLPAPMSERLHATTIIICQRPHAPTHP